jgi:hypothetical protein
MEQVQEGKDHEQVEVWAADEEAKAGEAALRQDRVGIAPVQAVVKKQPIN